MPNEQVIPDVPDDVAKELLKFIQDQSRPISWLDITSRVRADDPVSQVKAALIKLLDLGYVRKIQGEERAVLYEWVDPDDEIPF